MKGITVNGEFVRGTGWWNVESFTRVTLLLWSAPPVWHEFERDKAMFKCLTILGNSYSSGIAPEPKKTYFAVQPLETCSLKHFQRTDNAKNKGTTWEQNWKLASYTVHQKMHMRLMHCGKLASYTVQCTQTSMFMVNPNTCIIVLHMQHVCKSILVTYYIHWMAGFLACLFRQMKEIIILWQKP